VLGRLLCAPVGRGAGSCLPERYAGQPEVHRRGQLALVPVDRSGDLVGWAPAGCGQQGPPAGADGATCWITWPRASGTIPYASAREASTSTSAAAYAWAKSSPICTPGRRIRPPTPAASASSDRGETSLQFAISTVGNSPWLIGAG
jgi:hypothetical protein